jgi:hypothetical protein
MRRAVLLPVCLLLSAAVAGCTSSGSGGSGGPSASGGSGGSSGPNGSSSSSSGGSGGSGGLAVSQLDTMVLGSNDLPRSWKPQPATSGTASPGWSCGALQPPLFHTLPQADANFATGTTNLPSLAEVVASGSAGQVSSAWTSFTNGVNACRQMTIGESGQSIQMTLTPITSFPKMGDQTDAFQIATTIDGAPLTIQAVAIRKGAVLIGLTYESVGQPNVAQLQQLAAKALAHVTTG